MFLAFCLFEAEELISDAVLVTFEQMSLQMTQRSSSGSNGGLEIRQFTPAPAENAFLCLTLWRKRRLPLAERGPSHIGKFLFRCSGRGFSLLCVFSLCCQTGSELTQNEEEEEEENILSSSSDWCVYTSFPAFRKLR